MWTRSLQNIIFISALNEYLTTERLLTLPECEQLLDGESHDNSVTSKYDALLQ